MKLLIRADANSFIATGHVMRCISIAQAALREEHEVKFIVADLDAEVLLKKYNMRYICLNTTWNEMDGEIEALSEVIEVEKPDCVLVDSYYVTEKYLSALRLLCKVAFIDDLNMFTYPCDILICYANYYKKFNYQERYPSDTKLLLGPRYAPLRQTFRDLKPVKKENNRKSLLIMSGGTDEYHIIANILQEYIRYASKRADVTVVAICGVYNRDYDYLVKKYGGNSNVKLLTSVDNIEKYMLEADVAISAGGSTLYELCACGTPTVCYAFADNQLDNVTSFANDEVMIYGGDVRQKNVLDKIISNVAELLVEDDRCIIMRKKMQTLVDGNGACRIVKEIENVLKEGKIDE